MRIPFIGFYNAIMYEKNPPTFHFVFLNLEKIHFFHNKNVYSFSTRFFSIPKQTVFNMYMMHLYVHLICILFIFIYFSHSFTTIALLVQAAFCGVLVYYNRIKLQYPKMGVELQNLTLMKGEVGQVLSSSSFLELPIFPKQLTVN